MEVPPSVPHMTSYGVIIPPGFNISVAADALGMYDTNPVFQVQPSGDEAQRYSGNVALTYLSKHTFYQAAYTPSFSYYRKFTSLNSTEQNFSQNLWQEVSPRTGIGWQVDVRRYPSWGGSSFSGSSFGSLLMELSGLTALNLISEVSTANTGFTLEHKLNRRSRLRADFSGGVSKYVHSNSNQFLGLLTAPDSSTWAGQMSLAYGYDLSSHRSLGVAINSSYFVFTAQDYHAVTQSVLLRYSEKLRNGWYYSVAAGPEFREEKLSSGAPRPALSISFNAAHKTRKSAFRASLERSYQIGQAQGNLTSWDALVSAEHSIGRRCFAGVFGSYQSSELLVSTGQLGAGKTQTFAPAVEGGVRLSRHIVWFANYGFSAQKGALTQQQNIYRQQFVSGLSFNVDSLFLR